MHLVMFDIDGTLVESTEFDDACFKQAVDEVLKIDCGNDWSQYTNVTDTGLLQEILEVNHINADLEEVVLVVKEKFFSASEKFLKKNGLAQINGSNHFLQRLREIDEIQLAIATGGWRNSAEMKLRAAGVDFSDIPFSSSDDDITRVDIMQSAADKSGISTFSSKTYFGDGVWDKKACAEAGYDFIAIGKKVEHPVRYNNFTEINFDTFVTVLCQNSSSS